MTAAELVVVDDPDAAARRGAGLTADILAAAIGARTVAHWVTTGGSSAPPLYEVLSSPPVRDRVDWTNVHVWWGDERYVPPDHPQSNTLPFTQVMLRGGARERGSSREASGDEAGVVIPSDHVHVVPVSRAIADAGGPEEAARAYDAELRRSGPALDPRWPVFDLVILGIGPDGHMLSVFPGSTAWDATDLAIPIPAPTHIEPHVERVTLHPSIVAAARRVLVIATGEAKADVLARALAGETSPRELPATAAAREGATWILDRAAGSRVSR